MNGTAFATARKAMVEEQLVPRGVKDRRVLDAMLEVERHRFVPEGLWHQAYEDRPLPVGHGQTISQPYIVAAMTEALSLAPGHRVLEIGTGTGYQTAILARLCGSVFTVEIVRELSLEARKALARAGARNVRFRMGDGNAGWPDFAPYDRVIVTAAAETMPQTLADQLADSGRMVVPIGPSGVQTLTLGVKHGSRLVQRGLMSCVFVPFVKQR